MIHFLPPTTSLARAVLDEAVLGLKKGQRTVLSLHRGAPESVLFAQIEIARLQPVPWYAETIQHFQVVRHVAHMIRRASTHKPTQDCAQNLRARI